MKKVIIFAFQGEPVCFAHAMLNVLNMDEKGYETGLIIEGSACSLIGALKEPSHPQHKLYSKIISKGLLAGVCRACCHQMGTLEEAEAQGLPLLSDMAGHPPMEPWISKGYEVITL
jgi:hypothetical protein